MSAGLKTVRPAPEDQQTGIASYQYLPIAMNMKMQQLSDRSKVVATQYRKDMHCHDEYVNYEILPLLNLDLANIMSLPGWGHLISEPVQSS